MSTTVTILLKAKDKASPSIKDITKNLKNLGKTDLSSVTSSLSNFGSVALGLIGAAGIGALTKEFVDFASAGVSMAIDLESQMKAVQAVLGVTNNDMRELTNLAQDLGVDPNLKVTALEAAQAIEVLAKNGLDMTTIMNGAARSSVLLANSTGATLGKAADIVTDALAIFNLETSDLTSTMDALVGATNLSKFGINDVADAVANGGAVFSAAGVPIEEFLTLLAGTSSAFKSGAEAGTSLRNFMLRLTAPTNEAKEAMQSLGLQVFDSEGEFIGLQAVLAEMESAFTEPIARTSELGGRTAEQNQVLAEAKRQYEQATKAILFHNSGVKELSESSLENYQDQLSNSTRIIGELEAISGELVTTTSELTDEQRAQALQTIFGARTMTGALSAIGLTEEGFADLLVQMEAISAEDQAATRIDSVAGAMEILNSIVESIQLSIGNAFLPLIRSATERLQGFATSIANVANPALEAFRDATQQIIDGDIGGGFASLGTGVTEMLRAFGASGKTIAKTITFLDRVRVAMLDGLTPVEAVSEALLGLLPSGVQKAIEFISNLIATISTFVKDNLQPLGVILGAIATKFLVVFSGSVISTIIGGILSLLSPIGLLMGAIGILARVVIDNWDTISAFTADFVARFKSFMGDASTILTPLFTNLQSTFGAIIAVFSSQGIRGAIQAFIDLFPSMVGEIGLAIRRILQSIDENFNTNIVASIDSAKLAISGKIDEISSIFGSIFLPFSPLLDQLSGLRSSISEKIQPSIDFLKAVPSEIVSAFSAGGLGQAFDRFLALSGGISGAVGSIFDTIKTEISNQSDDLSGTFSTAISNSVAGIENITGLDISGVFDSIFDAFDNLPNVGIFFAIGESISTVLDLLSGLGDSLFTVFEGLDFSAIQGLFGDLVALSAPIKDIFVGLFPIIVESLKSLGVVIGTVAVVIVGAITSLFGGVVSAIEPFAQTFVNVFNNVINALRGAVQFITGLLDLIIGGITGDEQRITTAIETIKTGLTTFITSIWEGLKSLVAGAFDTLLSFFVGFGSSLFSFFGGLIATLTGTTLPELVNSIQEKTAQIIVTMITILSDGWANIKNIFLMSIRAVIGTVAKFALSIRNAWIGMITSAQALWVAFKNRLTEIWDNTVGAIIKNVIAFGRDFVDEIQSIWSDISTKFTEAKTDLTDKVTGIIDSIISLFTDTDWVSVGLNIIEGIKSGVSDAVEGLINTVSSAASSALAAAKSALGIESPSREFASQVGLPIMQGWQQGISNNSDLPENAIIEAGTQLINIAEGIASQGGQAFEIFNDSVTDELSNGRIVKAIELSIEEAMKVAKQTAKDNEFDPFSFITQAANAIGSAGSFFGNLFQAQELDPIQDKLNDINDEIQQFIDARIPIPIGLLNERNRLNDEFVKQQEKLNALQEQQQKFDFLSQQITLMQQLTDLGLNPADILGGVQLGVDASIPDLVDAIALAMEALVNQAENTLQIASPSKVFARIGRDSMAGLIGVLSDTSPLANVSRQIGQTLTDDIQQNIGMPNVLQPSISPISNIPSMPITTQRTVIDVTITSDTDNLSSEIESKVEQVVRDYTNRQALRANIIKRTRT